MSQPTAFCTNVQVPIDNRIFIGIASLFVFDLFSLFVLKVQLLLLFTNIKRYRVTTEFTYSLVKNMLTMVVISQRHNGTNWMISKKMHIQLPDLPAMLHSL